MRIWEQLTPYIAQRFERGARWEIQNTNDDGIRISCRMGETRETYRYGTGYISAERFLYLEGDERRMVDEIFETARLAYIACKGDPKPRFRIRQHRPRNGVSSPNRLQFEAVA